MRAAATTAITATNRAASQRRGEEQLVLEEPERQGQRGEGRGRHPARDREHRHPAREPAQVREPGLSRRLGHRPGGHEQRALGDRVRDHVERGGARGLRAAHAVQRDHVAVLGDRRVREDLLELVLGEREQPADHDRGQPDHQQPVEHDLVERQQRMHPAQHQHAGGHHRRRVQVGRHRRGRGHRARQPEVQRHLRALGQRGDGDQRTRDGRRRPGLRALEQLRQRERPVRVVEQHRAEQQRHRADAGHQQCHERRAARFAPVTIEPDQEVRRHRGQIEEDEQQDEVTRAREPDHRDHEHGHPGPEAPAVGRGPPTVLEMQRQVRRGVGEHGGADARRQQRVQRGEPVQVQVQPQAERRRPRHVDTHAAGQPGGEARREPADGGERRRPRGSTTGRAPAGHRVRRKRCEITW